MMKFLTIYALLCTALTIGPVRAELQVPSELIYPIIEDVIAKHGDLPDIQRLGAQPTFFPPENYSWIIGEFVAGYYTDWPNVYFPILRIEAFKAPLVGTCSGAPTLSEKLYTRTAGDLIIVTFDCDDSRLSPDGFKSRTVFYFVHFTEFKILQLFTAIGIGDDASYQRFLDLMLTRMLFQLGAMSPE